MPRLSAKSKQTAPGIDVSAYRIRLLPNFIYHHPIAPKLSLSARVGIGIDYIHESATLTAINTTSTTSDTAFAFELGGGVWYFWSASALSAAGSAS